MTTASLVRTWAGNRRRRRLTYLVAAALFALLSILPRPYLARARIMPQDTANAAGTSNLLSLIGGQSQNVASLLAGGRPSNDLYLIIGRSDSVVSRVIDRLKLVGPSGYPNVGAAKHALDRKIDVHMLLGGVMEIETKTHDPEEAKRLTSAYVDAVSTELAYFGEQLIVNKQRIIDRRFSSATARVAQTETALNAFRRAHNLAAPGQQLGLELSLRANLQAQLQTKQVEIETLQQFSGPDNIRLQAARTEIAALQQQIARSAAPTTENSGPNLASAGELTTQYLNLYRDFLLAQGIYEVYARSAEQVAVDQLAAETASYVQVIDPAYIDSERHYNIWAVGLLAAILLLAAFTEIYGPLTGLVDLDEIWGKSEAAA